MATRTTNIQNQPPRNGHGPTAAARPRRQPPKHRSRIYPCAGCATSSPPSTPSLPCPCFSVCALELVHGFRLKAKSCSFTHPDTTASPHNLRQTERYTVLPPFSSVFLAPLGPHFRPHSRTVLSVSLTASPTSPSPLAEQPFNSIPPSALPEASGLLAGCRHARRHIATRANAAHPLVTAEEFKLSRSRLSSSLTLLTSHVVVAQPNRRRRCCRRRQVRLPLLSSVVVPVKWTMHCHCHLATPM
jgi:hypothetical protein